MNSIFSQCGLYTDLISIVNDYSIGDLSHWKGKYDSVIHELNTENEQFQRNIWECTIQEKLNKLICHSSRNKIACIMHVYSESCNNNEKTASIYENFKRYGVVGIHRVAFDNLVFRLKQMMKVKDYKTYEYKSVHHMRFGFEITMYIANR